MFLKLLIISLILVCIVMLALGIKLWFDPDAEFTVHSCALDNDKPGGDETCLKCQLQNPDQCPEKAIGQLHR